eukprot:scaffold11651_cov118-Isochrysis_galbana.AAC.10
MATAATGATADRAATREAVTQAEGGSLGGETRNWGCERENYFPHGPRRRAISGSPAPRPDLEAARARAGRGSLVLPRLGVQARASTPEAPGG